MYDLPYPGQHKSHGLAINLKAIPHEHEDDCCTAGAHLKVGMQNHWNPGSPQSHTGDLKNLTSNTSTATYLMSASKPSLFITDPNFIGGKAMTLYEDKDDFGTASPWTWKSYEFGSAGPAIACCNIKLAGKISWIKENGLNNLDQSKGLRGRGLDALEEDVEVFTPEESREMFGYDPEEDEEDLFLNN